MKSYLFGYGGKTISWYGKIKGPKKGPPAIWFTKNKKVIEPENIGILGYPVDRKMTLWEALTSTRFVFRDVDALRFWLQSMTENVNEIYPKDDDEE